MRKVLIAKLSLSLLVAWALVLGACTRPNPNACCASDEQCAALGADELRPCAAGQACGADFTCVAAECATSLDCPSPDAPICSLGLCIGTCGGDADCADVPDRPFCSSAGTCVGCLDASSCPASAAICDAETQACRGCERDDECASGVCVEIDGVCAAEKDVIYVASVGAADTGECPRSAPCLTLGYALQRVAGARNVVRVAGGFTSASTPITITSTVTIDGTSTTIQSAHQEPQFTVTAGTLTLGGLTLPSRTGTNADAVVTRGAGKARLGPGTVVRGLSRAEGGTLEFDGAQLELMPMCTGGTISMTRCSLSQTGSNPTYAENCNVRVAQSRFDSVNGIWGTSGGLVLIENNLFVVRDEYADLMAVNGASEGSSFRFNTVVNIAGIDGDGVALYCDGSIRNTSNVFAYASAHPLGQNQGVSCPADHSLFDTVAVSEHVAGAGNVTVNASEIFVDRLGGDYRLKAGSPGLGAALPGLGVVVDIDGLQRGAAPDMGAFESP